MKEKDLRIPTTPWKLAQRIMQGGAAKKPPPDAKK